ncbi:MAG: hypothetical protein QXY22_03300 [Candidatus Nitrosotenuis sp.]
MSSRMWLGGIDGVIPGGITAKDFSIVAKVDSTTAKKMLTEMAQNQIGRMDGETIEFTDGDKIKAALYAVLKGATIDDAAAHLSWRDFEGLAAQILEEKNFSTVRNHIMTNPRMEIDIIGIKLGIALLIDCKHWQKHSPSALDAAVQKQIERTKHYVAKTKGAVAAPVIVTLYQDRVSFINKVPIVPIFQLSSFIDEFYGNLEDIKTIRKE